MATATVNAPATGTAMYSTRLEDLIRQSLLSAKSGTFPDVASDPNDFAASLLAGLRDAVIANPSIANMAKKDLVPFTDIDPSTLAMKGWFSSVIHAVETYGPILAQALSKDYKPYTPRSIAEIVQTTAPQRLQDKAWTDFVTRTLVTLAPMVLDALRGTKDFKDPANIPTIEVPPEAADKGWFTSALNVIRQALPIVIQVAAAVA